jgi:hypothetical protein
MSSTDAILVLAATLGAAVIIATSLDSLRKSLVESLHVILSELEWHQNGTGTRMQRRIERAIEEGRELERKFPGLAAFSLLPHQNPPQAPQDHESQSTSAPPSMAQTLGWRLGRLFARRAGSKN